MKMPVIKRNDLEKLAWSWIEAVPPDSIERIHLETAYRIGLKNCKNCRRNCHNNPRCLSGLGEEKYMKSQPVEVDPLECYLTELRDPSQYVGLKNLGATCYVNSLIQVWFHNEDMRRIVYKWDILEDPEELENLTYSQKTGLTYQPKTVVGQLQYIFAMMQFGNRNLLDPTNLAVALSLDTGTQQDAQEFSKLLLAHIEGKLQQNHNLRAMLQKLTQGTYVYVNRCSTCGTEYETPTTFYELDLQLASTLKEAIENYLTEEELFGPNKYHCRNCNEKKDAKRFIRLNTLPDTLNFQLLRFVFHRESAQKKKLTSSIQFPEELNMSDYVNDQSQSHLYNLVAVLSHKGPSAHSGHYIVNICNSSGEWYQFSDDKVEKMQNKRIEDGINEGNKPAKRGRILKGCLSSNSAYMLVYKKQQLSDIKSKRNAKLSKSQKDDINNSLTNSLKIEIPKDNFEHSIKRKESSDLEDSPKIYSPVKKQKKNDLEKNIEISKAVKKMDLNDENEKKEEEKDDDEEEDHQQHFLLQQQSLLLTQKHQEQKQQEEQNDNNGKMNIDNNYESKDVNNAHNGCNNVAMDDNLHYNTSEFDKWELSQTLRDLVVSENEKYECSQFEIQKERKKEIDYQNKKRFEVISFFSKLSDNCDWSKYMWIPISWLTKWLSDNSGKPETIPPIDNTSLLCTHKKLDPSKVNRAKCIPSNAANFLYDKYGNDVKLDQDSLCLTCVKKRCKFLRFKIELKKDFKNVTELMKNSQKTNENSYIVGATSLKNWQSLATDHLEITQDESENEDLNENNNKNEDEEDEHYRVLNFNDDLLCDHGGLITIDSRKKIVPSSAWQILKKYFQSAIEYPIDTPLCPICLEIFENAEKAKQDEKHKAKQQKEELGDLYFMKNRHEILKSTNKTFFIVEKGFLDSWRSFIRNGGRHPPAEINNAQLLCIEHKGLLYPPTFNPINEWYNIVREEEWNKLTNFYKFDYAIEIKNIGETSQEIYVTVPEECSMCIKARIEQEKIDSLTYEKARIYIHLIEESSEESEVSKTQTKTARPSRSRRKAKGSHEIEVSSDTTLKQLKIIAMKFCGAAPCDQHLMLGEYELDDPDQNIGALGVFPGSILKLKIDSPPDTDGNLDMNVNPEASSPEKGFKGTELVSS